MRRGSQLTARVCTPRAVSRKVRREGSPSITFPQAGYRDPASALRACKRGLDADHRHLLALGSLSQCRTKGWPSGHPVSDRESDMAKVRPSNWTEQPADGDFDSASDYLSLLLPADTAEIAVQRLRNGPLLVRRANDLLRASGLSALPEDNPTVAKKMKHLKGGGLLSPVLCLRGDLHTGALLTIADGYHRICASYLLDEDAEIPCRLAELPRREETLAGAVGAGHNRA